MGMFKDIIDYRTGIAMLDIEGLGLLCAYGGPHLFPSDKWKGDAGIVIYRGSSARAKEYPNIPIRYDESGKSISMALPGGILPHPIAFTKIGEAYSNQGFGSPILPKKANSFLHALAGGLSNTVTLAKTGGLESVIVCGEEHNAREGALSLERSAGAMLAPYLLGTAWTYQSWLYHDNRGATVCGQVTDAFSSIANPKCCERIARRFVNWLTRHLVDSGVQMRLSDDGLESSRFRHGDFRIPIDGTAVTGDFATLGDTGYMKRMANIIGGAVIIPFKEYPKRGLTRHIVRLHCLTSVYCGGSLLGAGPGLVEMPLTLDRTILPTELSPRKEGDAIILSGQGIDVRIETHGHTYLQA